MKQILSLFLSFNLLFASPTLNWYYNLNKESKTVTPPKECSSFIDKYNTYYVGDTSKKVIYLTFDEGYENGYTAKILDILKEHKVPAAFFVVKPYITGNPDLIKRMEDEGHIVGNHSWHHPDMAQISDPEKFKQEFEAVESAYKEVTGKDMKKFFRPPMGKFNEESLKRTKDLGYKTIFWSFAYKDWIKDEQPSKEEGKKKILEKAHNGEIMLLHAVSSTNTSILGEVIEQLKSEGYEFKSLDDL